MAENRRAPVSTWDGSFNISLRKASALATLAATVLGIMVLVYGSARAGVAAAVKEEIQIQIESEQSPLNHQIQREINKHETEICEPRWGEIQSRMTRIEVASARVETKIDILLERGN